MIEAFLLGAAAQSALIVCGLVVYWVQVSPRVIGALAGFGAGALVAAVAFDLIPEAEVMSRPETALWLLLGAGLFVVSDAVVERRFGSDGSSGPLGIVVGAVVDGVPESVIFGIQVSAQAVSGSFLGAVWISNVPQALAPSADLARSGWKPQRLVGMWGVVVLACGIAAALGYGLVEISSDVTGARAAAVAAGGLLAMLTNSLMPYAFDRAGAQAGIWTVVGFAASLGAT